MPGTDANRFLADFETMSGFGATANGGVDRQAASAADIALRRWFEGLLEERGFVVEYDQIGNQFGLLELTPGAPYVLVGSHMDSQPTAGRFDGAYGVLAAAYAATRVRDELTVSPPFNIAVVNWFNEEGSRFAPSMMGSSVYVGSLDLAAARAVTDRDGITVEDAVRAAGFEGTGTGPVAAYAAEIHIEQGRILERSGSTIGLVTATWAARKYVVTFTGEQAHSGATVMEDRKDALYAAASLIVFARKLADQFPGALHTAVGQLDVYPNSPVVVASQTRLLLDLRSADESVIDTAAQLVDEEIGRIREDAGVHVDTHQSHAWGINPYQPEGVELARASAARLGLPHSEILTVAGHDSVNLKSIVPTVMLFVPSIDGISHNEAEETRDTDSVAGVDMLTEVVRDLVSGALEPDSSHSSGT